MSSDDPGLLEEPRVVRVSTYLFVLAPIRLALGLIGLAAATVGELRASSATAAFALGALVSAVALVSDRRFSQGRLGVPLPLPPAARGLPLWRVGVAGVFPSTVGVAALAAIALTFDAGLAAVLAGILAGMAVATVISWLHLDAIEQENDYRLYLEDAQRGRGRGRVFSARR